MYSENRILHIILIWLLAISWISAQEKQVIFEQYTYRDGLESGIINDLVQDEDGLLWIASIDGLFKFDGYKFIQYSPALEDSCSVNSLIVVCLENFNDQHLLIGTTRGLQVWDPINSCFQTLFPVDKKETESIKDIFSVDNEFWFLSATNLYRGQGLYDNFININTPAAAGSLRDAIYLADFKNVAVGHEKGLVIYDLEGKHQGYYPYPSEKRVDEIYYRAGKIFLATNAGILIFDWQSKKFINQKWPPIIAETEIKDIIYYHDHLWVATRGKGAFQLDPINYSIVRQHTADVSNRASLSENHIRKLIVDDDQNLWLGSFTGINRTNTIHEKHPIYQTEPGFNSRTNFVLKLSTDKRGGVWYYARTRGLFYSKEIGTPAKKMDYPLNEFWISKDLNFIYPALENEVWILRGYEGLYRYNLDDEKWLPTITNELFQTERLVTAFDDFEDNNICWITSTAGLIKFNKTTFNYTVFFPKDDIPALESNLIYIGVVDKKEQKIWLGIEAYFSARLGYFDLQTETFHVIPSVKGLNTARFRDMQLGDDGHLWLSCPMGLLKINRKTNQPILLTTQDGLVENNAVHLQFDDQESIWVSSRDNIYQYTKDLELISSTYMGAMEDFVLGSSDKLPNGSILFGGKNGICKINTSAKVQIDAARAVFTQLSISNLEWKESTPLEKVDHLDLKYFNNTIQFKFSAPQYFNQKGIQYAYILKGFEDDWHNTYTELTGNYTNLNPGNYTLMLKAINENSQAEPPVRQISITIAAPWWKTKLAYFIYLVTALAGIYLFYRFQLNRKLALQETKQLRQLDTFKTKFFTNITHEFRTPLSLILGPAKRLKERMTGSDKNEITRIVAHSEHLLEMINQMLDLQRIQEGKMPLYPEQIDIVQQAKLLLNAFESKAKEKNIELHFNSNCDHLTLFLDKNILRHALTNLISNAVKFTPADGAVYFNIDKKKLGQGEKEIVALSIRDTGPGIATKDQERLFERFEQLENSPRVGKGSGIGLAFAKELVELLGGTLKVTSTLGEGAIFTLTLIPDTKAIATIPVKIPNEINPPHPEEISGQNQILLVEDHDEMRQFIKECLSQNHQVITAKNGAEGLALAKEKIPDLIVSDVMMPIMNGYQMCAALKSEISTSHIPCILLTAKDSESSRIYGLEQGAADYLGKPFSEKELLIRVGNILELRQRIQEQLRNTPSSPNQKSATPVDQKEIRFVQQARKTIQEQIDEPGFGVAQLADALHLSRTQLNRKLKALIGISPSAFLLNMRIDLAKSLLADPSLNINEIAYQCGFADASYFTKVFQKETGLLPSTYREEL